MNPVSLPHALLIALCLVPVGCGSKSSPGWQGGLYGVWEPQGAPVGVMILHQGHDCFAGCRYDDSLMPAAEAFAARGFLVYGFEMPPDPHDAGPIERYYHPVLDLIATLPPELPVYMAGLSGGGWTTTVVTAIEPRVVRGYSVDGDPASSDWEQRNPPFPYATLYSMAGERLMHVYIPNEPGGYAPPGVIGYSYVLDETSRAHVFSPWTVEFILSDIGLGEGVRS